MAVVVEGDDGGRLGGTRHHHPDVLADLLQVVDEFGVAGVETDANPGQVGTLRQRVHGDDTVGAVLQDRPRRALPGELHVALIGEHRHVVDATPGGDGAEVVARAGRIARRVDPQRQRSSRVRLVDGVEGQLSVGRERHGNRTAPGEDGAHLVGGVGDLGVQHRVAVRTAQLQPLRKGADELLRADARGHLAAVDGDVEASGDPVDDRPAQFGRAGTRRVAAFALRRRQRA